MSKEIIIITGASSGMGREFFDSISQKEMVDEIWVLARRKDRLEELKSERSKIVPIEIDLTDGERLRDFGSRLQDENPRVKILVNCAGFGKFDHYENIPVETELNMIDLNCRAMVSMINYSLPYMTEGTKIINFASCAGFQPIPYINIYAASKSFVISYSRALNLELKYRKITVTAVCPYWTKTEFFDRAINREEKPVVIKYDVMYDAKKVVEKAIKDAYKGKDVSVYGKLNNAQRVLVKLLPHKAVMKIWMKKQKLGGTPEIR